MHSTTSSLCTISLGGSTGHRSLFGRAILISIQSGPTYDVISDLLPIYSDSTVKTDITFFPMILISNNHINMVTNIWWCKPNQYLNRYYRRRRRRFWHATHDCVAPYVDIILHRGRLWAKSAASGSVRWWCFRSWYYQGKLNSTFK